MFLISAIPNATNYYLEVSLGRFAGKTPTTKERSFKFKLDPQPDSSIQPKALGLLHTESNFHCILYIKIISEDLKSTRPRAPCSLKAARKVLRRYILGEVQKNLRMTSKVLEKPSLLDYEVLGGLSD